MHLGHAVGKSQDKLRLNPRKAWYRNLEEVVTEGDDTVTFVLKRPQPAFLMLLASRLSRRSIRAMCRPPRCGTKPIGTGPFKFVEYKRNEHIKFVKNTDYWKQGGPISTRSSGRSSRTGRRRRSPLSPASST